MKKRFFQDGFIKTNCKFPNLSGNKRVFTRLGILGMYQRDLFGDTYYGFGVLPTIGFGFNFF